jgi:hypothetical protein
MENDMTSSESILPLSLALAALPLPAAGPAAMGAPEWTAQTRYCLRVDPGTGSRIETIQCRTRGEWAALEVNVDREWAENGVRVIA